MFKVTAYHCDHCRKSMISKSSMEKHEAKCPYNPKTKACSTCEHFRRETGPGTETAVPICMIGKMKSDPENRRNPYGMRSGCEFHAPRHDEE